jgi:hypothetical protein
MKTILFILSFLFLNSAQASEISAWVTLEGVQDQIYVKRAEDGLKIPVIISDKNLRRKIQTYAAGSDLLIEGHITYIEDQEPHKLKPVFLVEKLKKISLSDLHPDETVIEPVPMTQKISTQELILSPTLNVSPEIASTITLTTSFLLLEDLAAGPLAPAGRRELDKLLIISTGSLATLYFIYMKINRKNQP